MLIDAFKYILPVEENKHCSSMMFSSIIRESSNIYEIVSKTILKKMYENVTKPNIHDFVFLSKKLKLNSVKIESSLLNPLSKSEKNLLKPFQKIESGEIEKPEWWNAYNKIKHSPNSTKEHATLLNAISSLAAANIIITKYLGPGVVLGTLFKPKEQDGKLLFEIINIQTSKLFTTSTNSFSFDL
ncbi:MAG: hypothetical protein JW739_03090 [Opitutales bacterium]|nr:hypothetical protein [Opitutales bacterium]